MAAPSSTRDKRNHKASVRFDKTRGMILAKHTSTAPPTTARVAQSTLSEMARSEISAQSLACSIESKNALREICIEPHSQKQKPACHQNAHTHTRVIIPEKQPKNAIIQKNMLKYNIPNPSQVRRNTKTRTARVHVNQPAKTQAAPHEKMPERQRRLEIHTSPSSTASLPLAVRARAIVQNHHSCAGTAVLTQREEKERIATTRSSRTELDPEQRKI